MQKIAFFKRDSQANTYLFEGEPIITKGSIGIFVTLNESLFFEKELSSAEIKVVLENPDLFKRSNRGFYVRDSDRFVINDIENSSVSKFDFVVDDPGDPSVGIFGGVFEVKIEIPPEFGENGDRQDYIDFFKQTFGDFFDVGTRNVLTEEEYKNLFDEKF